MSVESDDLHKEFMLEQLRRRERQVKERKEEELTGLFSVDPPLGFEVGPGGHVDKWLDDIQKTESKETNPKDAIGAAKWRHYASVPVRVLWEVGVGMLEGAVKYGAHNYRAAGVRSSVYTDAAKGHIDQWIEGENNDPDTGLSHITKAICSLMVLRDGMLQDNFVDDRPLKHESLDEHRAFLQAKVDEILAKYPERAAPYTQAGTKDE